MTKGSLTKRQPCKMNLYQQIQEKPGTLSRHQLAIVFLHLRKHLADGAQ